MSGLATMRIAALLALLATAAIGLWLYLHGVPAEVAGLVARAAAPVASSPAAGDGPAPPIAVAAATVRSGDVPIYLSGIGTVQAYNTVGVKSRVDGTITQILFREGQDVKQGDVLAIIDPRPF